MSFANLDRSAINRWAETSVSCERYLPAMMAGTMIETEHDATPVDWLRPGDLVRTKDHGLQPLASIGPAPLRDKRHRYIRIGTNALAAGEPATELVTSLDQEICLNHPMLELLVDQPEALASAAQLNHWPEIALEVIEDMQFYTLALEQVELISANGVWVTCAAQQDLAPENLKLRSGQQAPRPCLTDAEILMLEPTPTVIAGMPAEQFDLKTAASGSP